MITFACTQCGYTQELADSFEGKVYGCPQCKFSSWVDRPRNLKVLQKPPPAILDPLGEPAQTPVATPGTEPATPSQPGKRPPAVQILKEIARAPEAFVQRTRYNSGQRGPAPRRAADSKAYAAGAVPPPRPGHVPVVPTEATAAIALGIFGLFTCGFLGIVALILGIVAKKKIDANPQIYTGGGQATAGIVLGLIDLVLMMIILVALSRN